MKHIHFDVVDSTQKEAWRMFEKGVNKMFITAFIQTDGIGTHGRKWYTEDKQNITFSLLHRVNATIDKFDNLTFVIAEIIQKIFLEYGCRVDIKKPNDLMINGKKVGGILLQTKMEKNTVNAIILGVGINTGQKKFNDEIKDIATSIINEYDIYIDVNSFINKFYKRFMRELKERNII